MKEKARGFGDRVEFEVLVWCDHERKKDICRDIYVPMCALLYV